VASISAPFFTGMLRNLRTFRCRIAVYTSEDSTIVEIGDHVLWTSEDFGDLLEEAAVQEDAIGDVFEVAIDIEDSLTLQAAAGMWGSETSKSRSKAHRDRTRPCKGKRQRYRKFLARLCEIVDDNPEGFDPDAQIAWPPSLVEDQDGREKVLQVLEARRAKAIHMAAMYEKVPISLTSLLC